MGGRGRGKKQPVAFTKPPEPAFIRRMKEQLGYKEGPTVDTKRAELEKSTSQDEEDRDDERPTVVVLKSGDISAEEAEKLGIFQSKEEDENEEESDGRVLFKKPTKRTGADADLKDAEDKKEGIRSKILKKESSMNKVKNKTLLSFDDEEDDDSD